MVNYSVVGGNIMEKKQISGSLEVEGLRISNCSAKIIHKHSITVFEQKKI